MKAFKICSVLLCLLFFCASSGVAQVWEEWSRDKDEVFEKAKEEDRFVLLFAGLDICPICQFTSGVFLDKQGPHNSLIANDYIGLFRDISIIDGLTDVMEYVSEYWELRSSGETIPIPWLYVINPNKEGEIVKSSFGPQTEDFLLELITVDLTADSELNWYGSETEAFNLAKAQNKNVLKLVGKGTSPNSQEVMEMLNANPINKLLVENYILWYQPATNPVHYSFWPLPVLSIISPENPDIVLVETNGVPTQQALETMIQQNTPVQVDQMHDIGVFTNGSKLYVKTNSPLSVTIYTITGSVAHQLSISEGNFSISLPKGIYIVKLSNGTVRKVVIR